MKQYMPCKPTRFGFKVWVLAESGTGYALRCELYTGRAPTADQAHTRKEHGLGFDVVARLSDPYHMKNHII